MNRRRYSSNAPLRTRKSGIQTLYSLLASLTIAAPAAAAHGVGQQSSASFGRSGAVTMGRPSSPFPGVSRGSPASGNVDATRDPGPQNETTIALDPANPANLVGGSNDYGHGDSQAGVATSFDGGATWTATTLKLLDPSLAKYDAQVDPAVAAHREGVFYYAFIDFDRGPGGKVQNRLAVARSSDGGSTWPRLGVIVDHTGPGKHPFEDKESLAVDATRAPHDGNVYVAWTRFPVNALDRIMSSRSTDGGASFSNPAQISDSEGNYQGSAQAVGPDGEIYVAWRHQKRIEIDRSTDGGVTFGIDRTVAGIDELRSPLPGASFRVPTFPAIAVDRSGGPNRGNVYVVWSDEMGVGAGPDILLSRSTDGGLSWSLPIRVSDDSNGSYQFFPAIAVASEGTIFVSFLDQRLTPGTPLYDVFVARSTDGGLSFGRNVRVSDETSDSALDGFLGTFIGDYSGLAVTGSSAFPYWTDTRPSNANAEGYTRRLRFTSPGDGRP